MQEDQWIEKAGGFKGLLETESPQSLLEIEEVVDGLESEIWGDLK